MKKSTVILLCVLGAFAFGGLGLYGYFNSLNTDRVEQETTISAQYQSNQLELDTYHKTIKEAVGIANVKSTKLDQVLHDAVAGRYGDSKSEAGSRQGQGGAFFSAIVEAYPDIKGQLDLYDRILNAVFAGREAFKQKQNLLLDRVRSYKRWMNDGLVQSILIKKVIGAPTELLQARVGKSVVHGPEALDKIETIVTSQSTSQSFESGEDNGVTLP